MLMSPIKCGVREKRGEDIQAIYKKITSENVCIVTVLFRTEYSVGGKVMGGEWEWKLGCTMSGSEHVV